MKEKIAFSVDRKLTRKDVDESSKVAEAFFHMQEKPGEIRATKENKQFFLERMPECDNVIYAGKKIIGFALIIPSNKELMKKFVAKKITEDELFEEGKKKIKYTNFTTIYLCSCFVKKEYRGKGLAGQAWIKSIQKIMKGRKIKPLLFAWVQTKEGEMVVRRVASHLKYTVKLLKEPISF